MTDSQAVELPPSALEIARDALAEIALAGMSGSGQESEEGMRAWHARRAWDFIAIAARAKTKIDAAIAQDRAARAQAEPVAWMDYSTQRPTGAPRRMLVDSSWGVREARWVAQFNGFQDVATACDEGMYDTSDGEPFVVRFWREHPPAARAQGAGEAVAPRENAS